MYPRGRCSSHGHQATARTCRTQRCCHRRESLTRRTHAAAYSRIGAPRQGGQNRPVTPMVALGRRHVEHEQRATCPAGGDRRATEDPRPHHEPIARLHGACRTRRRRSRDDCPSRSRSRRSLASLIARMRERAGRDRPRGEHARAAETQGTARRRAVCSSGAVSASSWPRVDGDLARERLAAVAQDRDQVLARRRPRAVRSARSRSRGHRRGCARRTRS